MDDKVDMARGRLRIVCKPSDDGAEIELPLRLLFVGDFMGKDERPAEDRVPVRVDRAAFGEVLVAHAPKLDLVVSSARSSSEGKAVRASLAFRSLSDFAPDGVAAQIPETRALLALRDALTSLKLTGDVEAFRAALPTLIAEAAARARLLSRLGLGAP